MPRRDRKRERYLRDRAERKMRRIERRRDYGYPMDYRGGNREYGVGYDFRGGRDRNYPQEHYMDYQQPREYSRYNDDMRYPDYRGRRDYADDDYDEDYAEDLKKWIAKLKKDDRFGLSMEQAIMKAKEMGVRFDEFDEEEFYAIYLMHVSDYPMIANEPHTYLSMAKSWLEDKDLNIDPSEKVCKYMYEIVMADE